MFLKIEVNNVVNLKILQDFINNLGESNSSFRYFNSRPISIIENHLLTILLIENGKAIGYGHLDLEDEAIWLGITITGGSTGKGKGDLIMKYLMNFIDSEGLAEINLAVDRVNAVAIKLYEKYGFIKMSQHNQVYYYKKMKNENP